MRCDGIARTALAAALVTALADAALAQDYTVSTTTDSYVVAPASATTLGSGSGDDVDYALSNVIPFDFPYFGSTYRSMTVCTNGFLVIGTSAPSLPFDTWTPQSLPSTSSPPSGFSGIVAPLWTDLRLDPVGAIKHFVTGTAPNRRFIVSWEQMNDYPGGSVAVRKTFQAHLHETTGRIVFAFPPGGVWSDSGNTWTTFPANGAGQNYFTIGLDSPGDGRYVVPSGYSNPNNLGQPASDFVFDPVATVYSGRILYDRLVAGASGIDGTVESNVPLSQVRLELRSGASLAAYGYTDANGDYSVTGRALDSSQTGALSVISESLAGRVLASAGSVAASSYTIAGSVSFASGNAYGTTTLGSGVDADGSLRGPLHVARITGEARAWAASRTTDGIASMDVYYDPSSASATAYAPAAGSTPASMRVGSAASGNPDEWDSAVLRRTYGRHVLASIAGAPSTAYDDRFDAITDDENAFAEGFGYYLHAILSGQTTYDDATGASTGTSIDLESPTTTVRAGSDVAASMAAGLFDLTDAANEAWDTVDGTGTAAERPFTVADALTAAPTANSFYLQWGASGFDGAGLSRIFIHHGLMPDDALEPNDDSTETSSLGTGGVRRANLVLNPYNEDWFRLVVAEATPSMEAAINYNRALVNTTVVLEVRSAAGALLATGTAAGALDPIRATTGPLAAGTYHVRVQHASGDRVPDYAVQAFSQLTLSSDAFVPWTVMRPFDVPLDVAGGIPPYVLSIEQGDRPPGLLLDSANLRVTGSPSESGEFDFTLSVRDSADPTNIASVAVAFMVNDVLQFALPEFIAFAQGKAVSRPGQYAGGTPPLTFTPGAGGLPAGITMAPGTFRFDGTPTTPGSTALHLDGVDVAGSADAGDTVVVVCPPYVPKGQPTTLAAGDSACGFWFDALAGSVATFSAKTAPKQPKRALRAFVLDPDWLQITQGKPKAGNGKASLAGFPCAKTGRYWCVVASDAGEATLVAASMKLAPPKAGSGSDDRVVAGEQVEVFFAGFDGTVLTFTAKPDRSGLAVRPSYLRSPSGAFIAIRDGDYTPKGTGYVYKAELDQAGTWSLVTVGKPGPQGALAWKYKLKHPKGAAYSAD